MMRATCSDRVTHTKLDARQASNLRTQIMGIVNVTTDSFSDDGLLAKGESIEEMVQYLSIFSVISLYFCIY